MNLKDFGYSPELEKYRKENKLDTFVVGRVILEHKDRYTVLTENGELVAELIGQMRFSAHTRNDLPVVGDWVTLSEYDVGKALIHHLFPRKTILERKAVGKHGLTQIIATNIDTAIIIQSVNR